MALVKSTDITFELPVLTITAQGERWTCRKLNNLTRGASIQVKEGRFLGMKIIDASGRRWIVRSIRKIGRIERWTVFDILFLRSPDWRLEYELEELPPVAARDGRSSANGGARSSTRKSTASGPAGSQRPADEPSDQTAQDPPDRDGTAAYALSTSSGGVMPAVKASTIDFDYPLLGFTRNEGLLCYSDTFSLTHASWVYVHAETLVGMELIDNGLRRWIVRSVEPGTPPRAKRWWHLFPDSSTVKFDLLLDEMEATTFEDLKRRFLEESDVDNPEAESGIRRATDLAAIFEAVHEQGSGLFC